MSGLSGSEASSPLPRLLAVAVLVLGMAVSFTVVPGVFSDRRQQLPDQCSRASAGPVHRGQYRGVVAEPGVVVFRSRSVGPAPSTPLRSDPPRHRFTRCSRSPSRRSAGGDWSRSTRSRTWPPSSWCFCTRGDTRPKPRRRGWPPRLLPSAGSSSNTPRASGRTRSASRCARAGYFAAGRSIESRESGDSSDNRRPPLAAAAGFLLGLATGVRYQNAVILAVVAGGIALWSASTGGRALTAYVWRRQRRSPPAPPSITSASDRGIRSARATDYLTSSSGRGLCRLSVRSAGDVLGAGRRFFCPAAAARLLLGDATTP